MRRHLLGVAMKRVKPGYSEVIQTALGIIPTRLHRYLGCDFFLGSDPLLAGLHTYTDASYGRSYRDVAHVAYVHNQPQLSAAHRATTVVLPRLVHPTVVVHELGHVVHERLLWMETTPVTEYASTDRYEAFAEAFVSWLVPGYGERPDDAFLCLMESL